MNITLTCIFWVSILTFVVTFVGYIYNRIIYWIGAFFSNLADEIIINDNLWFSKNTTIKDIYYWSKYKDGYPPNSIVECYRDYCDGYFLANNYRWIPGFNIFIATIIFICYMSKFTFALFVLFLRLVYKYFLKYVILVLTYIYGILVKIYHVCYINNLLNKIKISCNTIISKLGNIRIA